MNKRDAYWYFCCYVDIFFKNKDMKKESVEKMIKRDFR